MLQFVAFLVVFILFSVFNRSQKLLAHLFED